MLYSFSQTCSRNLWRWRRSRRCRCAFRRSCKTHPSKNRPSQLGRGHSSPSPCGRELEGGGPTGICSIRLRQSSKKPPVRTTFRIAVAAPPGVKYPYAYERYRVEHLLHRKAGRYRCRGPEGRGIRVRLHLGARPPGYPSYPLHQVSFNRRRYPAQLTPT